MTTTPHFTLGSHPRQELLRELLSYEAHFPELVSLHADFHGCLKLHSVATLHWSRQYELPWALDVSNLHRSDTVLDAGCGYSSFKLALAKRVRRVIGIDLILDSLKRAAHMCDYLDINNVELHHSDIATYQAVYEFDKIFCLSVLEHIPNDRDRAACLTNMIRLLRPGGMMVISYDVLLPASKAKDIYIDQYRSDEILAYLGQNSLKIENAAFHADLGNDLRIVSICTTYTKT